MNGYRIEHLLSLDVYTAPMYSGISSVDLPLPELKKTGPSLMILNTAPSYTQGEHWCAVYFTSEDGTCEFFDPYGHSPDFYSFTSLLLTKCKKIIYNQKRVQGNLSTTCGLHCLFFCLKRARGYSANQIMGLYRNDTKKNDNMIYEYMKHKYGAVFANVFQI